MRENERAFLVAESLVALASQARPDIVAQTRMDRKKGEWLWAMLSDHAWNGTDLKNKRHNAGLRRNWADRLAQTSQRLIGQAWSELGLRADSRYVTVFNPLSFANDILVTCEVPDDANRVPGVSSSLRIDDGRRRLVFVAPWVPPFGFRGFRLETKRPLPTVVPPFSAGTNSLAGPFYRLWVDLRNGGLSSLVHKASGQEVLLERERSALEIRRGKVWLNVRSYGFTAVKLTR